MAETKGKPETAGGVLCSYCGNDASCEDCRKAADKSAEHMCFDCYQAKGGQVPQDRKVHVCIPPEKMAEMYQHFLDDVTARAFDELWNSEKKKIRELSKQEVAQACFFEGSRFMYSFLQRMNSQEQQAEKKE